MENNRNQIQNSVNSDTSPDKINTKEEFFNKDCVENSGDLVAEDKSSSSNSECFNDFDKVGVKKSENSIINTNISEKSESVALKSSTIDSNNMLDPLSEINNHCDKIPVQEDVSAEKEKLVFSKLFPNVSIEKLESDELFSLFSLHNGEKLTISDLYKNFLHFISAVENDFAKKSLVSLQNKLISPGSLASSEKSNEVFFTKEQVLRMSPQQIAQNYNSIRKSQQKW